MRLLGLIIAAGGAFFLISGLAGSIPREGIPAGLLWMVAGFAGTLTNKRPEA